MDGKYLLDTNVLIAALASDQEVLANIDDAFQCFLCTTVLGELIYGALHSSHATENLVHLQRFSADRGVLTCDEGTANLYGEIKTALRKKGRPIPDNDIWIAASARQHSLTLVTRDGHFEEVDQLNRVRW